MDSSACFLIYPDNKALTVMPTARIPSRIPTIRKIILLNETLEEAKEKETHSVEVIINGTPVTLTGRESYMFVDLFEFYEFDLSASAGRAIITKLNGQNAQYTAELKDGDVIELAWKEK